MRIYIWIWILQFRLALYYIEYLPWHCLENKRIARAFVISICMLYPQLSSEPEEPYGSVGASDSLPAIIEKPSWLLSKSKFGEKWVRPHRFEGNSSTYATGVRKETIDVNKGVSKQQCDAWRVLCEGNQMTKFRNCKGEYQKLKMKGRWAGYTAIQPACFLLRELHSGDEHRVPQERTMSTTTLLNRLCRLSLLRLA